MKLKHTTWKGGGFGKHATAGLSSKTIRMWVYMPYSALALIMQIVNHIRGLPKFLGDSHACRQPT